MLAVTEAAELAWRVAADEAIRSGHKSIEPLHLLIGTCSVDKYLEAVFPQEIEGKTAASPSARTEWQVFQNALEASRLDPIQLRRAARQHLGQAVAKIKSETKVSRSQACRLIFEHAKQLARNSGTTAIGLNQLFGAILDSHEPAVAELIAREGVNIPECKSALAASQKTQLNSAAGSPPAIQLNLETKESGTELPGDLPQISLTLDASRSPFLDSASGERSARRLALFYELPLYFGAEVKLSDLLNMIVSETKEAVQGADRVALMVRDRTTGSLLLRAHRPAGSPAVSLTLADRAMREREGFIWTRSGGQITASLSGFGSVAGMYAPLLWRGEVFGVICVDGCRDCSPFDEDDLRLLLAVGHHAAMAIANHQLQEDLRERSIVLERMLTNFSPRIRQKLLEKAKHGRLSLGGEKSEVTILFSDIRGFTTISSSMAAEDVVEMLNDYFSVLVSAIFGFDGTVDKFVGDSILAVFGSPEADPKHYENAVRAAMEMQSQMTALNKSRSASGRSTCEIGIGVHCGTVLHGFIGSSDRMEFTVVGDPVNRASRYCAGAKAGEVLISPDVHQHVWRDVVVEPRTITTKHEGDFSAFRLKSINVRA
jgi:adenylate cyclase